MTENFRRNGKDPGTGEGASQVLSPERARELVLELRAHQIELEMQNEELRRAQRERAASQQRYFEFYDLAPVGYFTLDATGLILEANLTAATLLGMEKSALLRRPLTHFVLFADHDACIERHKQLFESGEPQAFDLRLVKHDGSSFWGQFAMTLRQNAEGSPLCLVVMSDITGRKRGEAEKRQLFEAVAQEKEWLSAVVNSIADEVLFANTDAQFTFVNSKGLGEFVIDAGGSVDVRENTKKIDVFRPDGNPRPVEEAPPLRALQGEVVQNQEEIIRHYATGKLQYREVSASPVKNAAGDIIGAVSVVRDVTERKQAEERLLRHQQLLHDVIDGCTSPVFLKDLDGRFITINAALERMLGMSREELKGKTDYDIAPKDLADYWRTHDEKVMATGKAILIEEVAELPDGHHTFLANKFPLVNVRGEIYGVGAVSHEITERKGMEEKLRSSEAFLSTILEQSPHTMWIANAQGTLIRTNQAMREMFQVTDEEVIGKYNLLQDEIVQEQGFLPQVRDVFEKGESVRFCIAYDTFRLKHLKLVNPKFLYLDVKISPIFGANGEVTNAVIQHVDITERKQAEEALRQSEERLRMALEASAMGTFEIDLVTGEGQWNTKEFELLGLKPGDIPSTPEAFFNFVHPDDIGMVSSRWESAVREGELDVEFRVVRADGETRWLAGKGRFIFEGKTVGNPDSKRGRVRRFLGVNFDVTARKKAEEALRESEQRVRRFYESDLIGVIFWNMKGEITEANDKFLKMLGYDRNDLTDKGIDWTAMTPPEYWHLDEASVEELKATGVNRLPFEKEYIRKDGSRIPILIAGAMLDEERLNGVAFVLDVAERKRAEVALRNAQASLKSYAEDLEKTVAERTAALREQTAEREQLQKELLRISEREKQLISQELHDGLCQNLAGTAFMSSLLHSQMAEKRMPEAKAAKEICDLLNTSVNEARNLSHGLHPVGPEGEALMNALSQLAGTVRNLFHIRCTFQCPEPVMIENGTVSTYLYRITQEAINNARKHGEADRVTISLRKTPLGLTLKIRDNGIGIPAKLPKKSGMGLAIMKRRASEIGASLSVRRGQTRGTVVTCRLHTGS